MDKGHPERHLQPLKASRFLDLALPVGGAGLVYNHVARPRVPDLTSLRTRFVPFRGSSSSVGQATGTCPKRAAGEWAKQEAACCGASGQREGLTRLTGLLTLLFMSATRPFTRSLEERGGRSGARRGPQVPSIGHKPATSRKETKTPTGDWTSK